VPVLKIKSGSSSVLTGFKGLMLVLIGLFQLILSTHCSSIMLCWWLLVHSGRHPVDPSFIRHGLLMTIGALWPSSTEMANWLNTLKQFWAIFIFFFIVPIHHLWQLILATSYKPRMSGQVLKAFSLFHVKDIVLPTTLSFVFFLVSKRSNFEASCAKSHTYHCCR